MKNKVVIVVVSVLVLAGLFLAGARLYLKRERERVASVVSTDTTILVRSHSPVFGSPQAKVTLVEFFDPECESCRAAYPFVKDLLAAHEGKVKLVMRYVPLHQNSEHAIQVLEAARMQGRFWEALGVMFQYQPEWADHHNPQPQKVWEFLPQAGVDVDAARQAVERGDARRVIAQDVADANALGVRGTPTFFINGKRLEVGGAEGLRNALAAAVDDAY